MKSAIPGPDDIKRMWDVHGLPERKRKHVTLVAALAGFFAGKLAQKDIRIDVELLHAAAMLHDIDKAVLKREGETHPDAGVRILKEEGYDAVADLVATHPLHMILNPDFTRWGWEQKLLFLADKMVKDDIISVEERFEGWGREPMDIHARDMLARSLPKVRALRDEVFAFLGISQADVARFAALLYT